MLAEVRDILDQSPSQYQDPDLDLVNLAVEEDLTADQDPDLARIVAALAQAIDIVEMEEAVVDMPVVLEAVQGQEAMERDTIVDHLCLQENAMLEIG